MAKKRRGFIIPSDWDGTSYTILAACVPDSSEWIATVKGCIYLLTRGYEWDETTGSVVGAQTIGKEIYNSMGFCDEILAALLSISQSIKTNSCGCVVGQGEDNEAGQEGGPVPGPVGDIVYQEPAVVSDRKCKAANLVHSALIDVIGELDAYGVDQMGVLGLGLAIAVVAGVIATAVATPLAGVIVAVAGAVAVFTARLLGVAVDLGVMFLTMATEEQSLVCDLYEASSVDEARLNYLATCEAGGMTAVESAALELLMTNALMNILFFDTPETAAFWDTYTPPVDCSSCVQPGACDVNFVLFGVGDTAGSGDLTKNGQVRTLTAREHPTNGLWYIQFQVGPERTSTLYTNCADLPAECSGTDDERFQVRIDSISPSPLTSTAAYECEAGFGNVVWVQGGDPPVTTNVVSFVEMIKNAPFTADVMIDQFTP